MAGRGRADRGTPGDLPARPEREGQTKPPTPDLSDAAVTRILERLHLSGTLAFGCRTCGRDGLLRIHDLYETLQGLLREREALTRRAEAAETALARERAMWAATAQAKVADLRTVFTALARLQTEASGIVTEALTTLGDGAPPPPIPPTLPV